MALYRIALPHALIPTVSALEKIQQGDPLKGLNAGANILTINFTPQCYNEKYVYGLRLAESCQNRFKVALRQKP